MLDTLEPHVTVEYAELVAGPRRITLSMEVRGCEPEDIRVDPHEGDVEIHILSGARPQYTVPLPTAIDPGQVEYTFQNGVLDLIAPVSTE